jgi:hypothetical protein
MIGPSIGKKRRFLACCVILASLATATLRAADHVIPYATFLEEFFWTFGCSPTAAAMVLSYWDTSQWDRTHRYKRIGYGRLVDYYQTAPCLGPNSARPNIPNTLSELKDALKTDYDAASCSGDGGTDTSEIAPGIGRVTNDVNGYTFYTAVTCYSDGDWCWDQIKWEIDHGRPFVWSTGVFDSSGHSVPAWGYTDDKYVIVYDTWEPGGREDWYYSHYLNQSSTEIDRSKVIMAAPDGAETSDIVLDTPTGGEWLFVGTTVQIWWYQWGTDIQTVRISYSLDAGKSWTFLATWTTPYNPNPGARWGVYNWLVPDPYSWEARVRLEAFDANGRYVAGDGSFGIFQIMRDPEAPTGAVVINGNAAVTNTSAVTLTLSCLDGQAAGGTQSRFDSGCADMRLSEDNTTWTAWEALASTRSFTLTGADGLKPVYVQFRDRVGNVSASFSDTITLDRTGPQATVVIDGGATYTTSPTVTLTMTCASGDCVQMRFKDAYSSAPTAWEPYQATKTYTLSVVPANGRMWVEAFFIDPRGLVSTSTDSIIIDTEAPNGSLLINGNAPYTNSPAATLSVECYDYQSGCSSARFSPDNVAWSDWEPVSATRPWTMTGGDGVKSVYVQFRDIVGHESSVISRTIVLERIAPVGSIVINAGEPTTNTAYVTLALSCTDATSGCQSMRLSNDSNTWTPWEAVAAAKAWTLASGTGSKRVFVQYMDVAGNVGTVSDTISMDTLFLLSTIDAALTAGASSIVVDSQDHVHISSPGGALRYATNASGSWTVTLVDKAASDSSIAVDGTGVVHISYYETASKTLKYATNAGGTWVTATVDPGVDVGRYSSLALDSNRRVHISYYDYTNADLKYATNASGSWLLSTVDSVGNVGQYSSIAVDVQNTAHISYYDGTNYDLKYATNTGGAWTAVAVDTTSGDTGRYTSIAADTSGKIHISYSGNSFGDLKYATNASGSWQSTTVDTRITHTAIALASGGSVRIVYRGATDYKLKYASNASGTWSTAVLPVSGNLLAYPALDLDSQGRARVSYADTDTNGNAALGYATDASGSWESWVVERAANPAGSTSLAVDANGKVHLSYLYSYQYRDPVLMDHEINYGLKYATNASGSWVTTLVDSGSFRDGTTSIALDSAGRAHISYCKEVRYPADHRLMYATNASGSWVTGTIESSTTTSVGYYSSIGVDKDDVVHVAYSGITDAVLRYATSAAGSGAWSPSDITGAAGAQVALGLDAAGKAHVMYRRTGGGLGYATNATGTWAASLVDALGGNYPSVAVDGDGRVHASHVHISGSPVAQGTLRHATNLPGSWVLTAVDNTGNAMNTAIAVDAGGRDHIGYLFFSGVNPKLKYATNASGAWAATSVDDDGDTGRDPSIGTDVYGLVHLGYLGPGLRYGHSPDISAPIASVRLNGGATYTSSRSVILTFNARDASGVSGVCVSETTSCTNWLPYVSSRTLLLSPGEGLKTVYVWFRDYLGNTTVSPFSGSVTLSSPPSFTDDPVQPGVTVVKAAHIVELRQAADALRGRYALAAFPWTDGNLEAGVTRVSAVHVEELRAALAAVFAAAGRTAPVYEDPSLVARSTKVKAAHINELRAAIVSLW